MGVEKIKIKQLQNYRHRITMIRTDELLVTDLLAMVHFQF